MMYRSIHPFSMSINKARDTLDGMPAHLTPQSHTAILTHYGRFGNTDQPTCQQLSHVSPLMCLSLLEEPEHLTF